MQSGSFVVAFVTARKSLQYIKPLTVKLQAKSQDATFAHQHIKDVTSTLQGLRDHAETSFAIWFEEAGTMAASSGFEVQKPRTCPRQTLRDNHQAVSTEEYFRVSVFVPFLDHLLEQMTSRFENYNMALAGLDLIPAHLVEKATPGLQHIPSGLQELATLWEDDLPDPVQLESEFNRWVKRWTENRDNLPTTAKASLKECNSHMYPNISVILRLLCTLPVTTSEVERSFSRLKTIKTYLRSTQTEDRLNGLALMRIHYAQDIDAGKVVDAFAARFNTKMKLCPSNFLKED